MTVRLLALSLALWLLTPVRAWAEARFVIQARGAGFTDRTAVVAEGRNPATTLGEQRAAAVKYAAELWALQLDSSVPVVIDVVAQKLGCDSTGAVLASAGAVSLFSGINAPGADPALFYPSALADRLAGRDLAPNEADIAVTINTSVDEECRSTFHGFYYGFDSKPGARVDLVQVIIHELGHGLGFSSFVDLDTGKSDKTGLDVFSSHIFDVAAQKTWAELSDEQRRVSASKVRGLAFAGARTTEAAKTLLEKGVPTLTLTPTPLGFVGAVGDVGKTFPDIEGPLKVAANFEGCNVGSAVSGALVLVRPTCMGPELEAMLTASGALGTLLALPSHFIEPAISLSASSLPSLPTLTISGGDAELLRNALSTSSLRARMHWDDSRTVGADAAGRPLLFATQPADRGSSVSHFDSLARPDLLMEPFISSTARHTFDLTWPALIDLGWAPFCGNRRLDAGEQCDEGEQNSDVTPDVCRKSCKLARCGDGVRDRNEACDQGSANSDTLADACRSQCTLARCGDGVIDLNEACDQGSANSDTLANACRSQCTLARCGDQVIDMGEACDDGAGNDDTKPGACRKDCQKARCGDHVVDDGEACDGSSDCSDTCRSLARTTDTVVTRPGADEDEGASESDGGSGDPDWVDPWRTGDDGEPGAQKSSGCSVQRERAPTWPGALLSLLSLYAWRRNVTKRASSARRRSRR
jgi:hypothetical protein